MERPVRTDRAYEWRSDTRAAITTTAATDRTPATAVMRRREVTLPRVKIRMNSVAE
jgi:hypothetical protein